MEKEKLTLEEKVEKLLENHKEAMFVLNVLKQMLAKKEIMYSEDVCAEFCIKPRALANWRKKKKIPFSLQGKKAIYFRSKIMDFFDGQSQEPEDEE